MSNNEDVVAEFKFIKEDVVEDPTTLVSNIHVLSKLFRIHPTGKMLLILEGDNIVAEMLRADFKYLVYTQSDTTVYQNMWSLEVVNLHDLPQDGWVFIDAVGKTIEIEKRKTLEYFTERGINEPFTTVIYE